MKGSRIVDRLIVLIILILIAWLSCAAQVNNLIELEKESFSIRYDVHLGIPQRVEWWVRDSDLGIAKRQSSFRFRTDKECPKPRVNSRMYANSGYQRGHMCPAADRSASITLMKQTFIMSNICPMTPHINAGAWKRTEVLERMVAMKYGACRCIASPLFFPKDTAWLANGRVAVPHAFIKILTCAGNKFFYRIFIIENL